MTLGRGCFILSVSVLVTSALSCKTSTRTFNAGGAGGQGTGGAGHGGTSTDATSGTGAAPPDTSATTGPGGGAPPGSCGDGVKDDAETDVDCGGGACPTCADGLMCLTDADCTSGVCDANGVCAMPADSCADGVMDGDETDVDCGGSCAP